jgi:hypothetical protein
MKGIKYITSKSDFLSFILSILGDYRLKWFEYGTSLRKNSSSIRRTKKGKVPTSKGQNRGIIRATPFFMSAIRQIKSQINKIYEESFEWAINKIINKK